MTHHTISFGRCRAVLLAECWGIWAKSSSLAASPADLLGCAHHSPHQQHRELRSRPAGRLGKQRVGGQDRFLGMTGMEAEATCSSHYRWGSCLCGRLQDGRSHSLTQHITLGLDRSSCSLCTTPLPDMAAKRHHQMDKDPVSPMPSGMIMSCLCGVFAACHTSGLDTSPSGTDSRAKISWG